MLEARLARLRRSAPGLVAAHVHVLGLAHVFGGSMIRRALGAAPPAPYPSLAAPRIRASTDAFGAMEPTRHLAFLREGQWAFWFGAEALRVLSQPGCSQRQVE
jgi:hypothetical protein